jgi:hypothetical protein
MRTHAQNKPQQPRVVPQERAQPHIQRLAINPKILTKGTCGQYNVGWAFRLDNRAPDDGFIVQQIDRQEWIGDCPTQGAPVQQPTYWEAWFVEKNRLRDAGTIASGVTDNSMLDTPKPGTSGMLSARGKVKFFPKATTGDLMTAWTHRERGWGCLFPRVGNVPEAADLPSTYTPPTWWNNTPVEGPEERSVKVSWSCCDEDKTKHTTNVTANP